MRQPKHNFDLNTHDLKPLPFSDEIEMQVLEIMLDDPYSYYATGVKYLKAKGMFYNPLNAEIWEIMQNVSKSGEMTIDKVRGVIDGLRDRDRLYHFFGICQMPSIPSSFESNCLLLNEFWIKRTIHRMGFYLNQNALNTPDALELLGVCSESTDKIYRHIAQMTEVTLKDGVKELAQELHDISISPDGMLGLRSAIAGINRVIKGYRKGNFIIVGGSAREGKTTFMLQEMRYNLENNIPVGCFSLEMKTSELILIMSCNALNLNTETVLDGALSAADMGHIGTYMERVKSMPLKVSDKPAIKISELKSVARMWKKNNDIKVLYIDHLHLMDSDLTNTNAEQKFTDIANQLKALSKELDIPIVCLAQLARKEKGSKSMHTISDLKYASGIEQAADVIMLIYRPELYEIETLHDGTPTKGYAKIHVGKLRLLPASDIICYFTGLRFEDWNTYHFNQKDEPIRVENPKAGITRDYRDITLPKSGFNPNDWKDEPPF